MFDGFMPGMHWLPSNTCSRLLVLTRSGYYSTTPPGEGLDFESGGGFRLIKQLDFNRPSAPAHVPRWSKFKLPVASELASVLPDSS